MRNRLVMLLTLLGLTSGGCATEDTERVAPGAAAASQPGEPAPSDPHPAAPPAGAPGVPAAVVAPGAAADPLQPAVPGATGVVRNTRTLEEVGVAIEAAIAAAASVPENGEDMCGIAYRGLNTMLTELRRRMPEQPANPLPSRDGFMEICRDMPPEVQQCLVISYAVNHQEECERASNSLDPAMRARIEALMGGTQQAAPPPAP